MRSLIFASLAALAAFSASPVHAQITTSDQEVEAHSLSNCIQNMGYHEKMDSDVRYLMATQCRLERLRSGDGTAADFRRVSNAIERGRVSFRQLDTSIEELYLLRIQVQGGHQVHTSASVLSQVLSGILPSVTSGPLPTESSQIFLSLQAGKEGSSSTDVSYESE